jgi:hypothetical protein
MAKSRRGLDMDAPMDDGDTGNDPPAPPPAQQLPTNAPTPDNAPSQDMDAWSDGDVDRESNGDAADGADGESDDGLFTTDAMKSVKLNEPSLGISMSTRAPLFTPGAIDAIEMSAFLMPNLGGPMPLDTDEFSSRPPLLNLPATSFPPGTTVWVGDPNDVVALMRNRWDSRMEQICGGRVAGRVLRHSGEAVMCEFTLDESQGLHATFAFPRACLLNQPVAPYDIRFNASMRHLFSDSTGLGPRAGHDKTAKEPVFGLLAPIDRAATIGSPCKTTQGVLEALAAGKIDEAEEQLRKLDWSVNRRRAPTTRRTSSPPEPTTADDVDDEISGICGPAPPVVVHNRALLAMINGDVEEAERQCDVSRALRSDSITLCLRAWHVKLMCGRFGAAEDLVNHATLLAPHELLLQGFRRTTATFRDHERWLRESNAPLCLTSSYRLERRVVAKRYFVPGDVIARDELLFACSSLDTHHDDTCTYCHKPRPAYRSGRAPDLAFCGERCFDASWNTFLRFERETCEFSVRSARSLIDVRRNAEHFKEDEETPLLQTALLAIRAWSTVASTLLDAAEASPQTPALLEAALHSSLHTMGLLPFPDGVVFRGFTCKVEYQLKTVHAVLYGRLPAPLKPLMDQTFFRNLVVAVHTYRKCLHWPLGDGTYTLLDVITRASGGMPVYEARSSDVDATLQAADDGTIFLVAANVIDPWAEIRVL